ncbi:MAG: hypothetical protein GY932_14720 [Arcobacter sp.]|nr:hypothetical protein [Arcobacter sp.]
MFRYIFIFIISCNILSSNENVSKTSELELFLFKVGFESLLKDVDINKDKTSLNEEEIKKINEKIELILSELYKDKRILKNFPKEISSSESINNNDLESLKNEVQLLKKELIELKNKKTVNLEQNKENEKIEIAEDINKLIKSKEKSNNITKMRVATDYLYVYRLASTKSKIIKEIKRDSIVFIEFCNKYNWCKISNKNEYVKRFLIKAYK